jgi:hypothetical protein
MKYLIFLIVCSSAFSAFAAPPAQLVVKNGSCPSGYYSNANYCVPSNANSQFAISKIGPCPVGYYSSSNYCLVSSEHSKLAVPKSGPCPLGYYSSGNYCLSSR